MGDRYLITGVQLVMFVSIGEEKENRRLADRIMDKQFLYTSQNDILADVADVHTQRRKINHEILRN